METNHALDILRNRLTTNLVSRDDGTIEPINTIFLINISIAKNNTTRKVKYLLRTNEGGRAGLQDITGLVGRAGGTGWNQKTGLYHVKGGDGSQPIYNISTELFGKWDAIPLFYPL